MKRSRSCRLRAKSQVWILLISVLLSLAIAPSTQASGTLVLHGSTQLPLGDGVKPVPPPGLTPDAATFVQGGCKQNQLDGKFVSFVNVASYQGRTITVRLTSTSGTIPNPIATASFLMVVGGYDCQPNNVFLMVTVGPPATNTRLIAAPATRVTYTNTFSWIAIYTNQLGLTFTVTIA